ncbi:MAG: bifunctional glutamate N-acetyltransferase/amino-acid acetyltransferase ArgJ [Alphaproteobacteria bacterium]|nr:bifunctional glutamate N-acetyltransferase/amino-acid acetyltransferase ArgJ [Alphaproteobacteria bacterium]MDE2163147.1 bifunctional glutamate N-acetyltransferase/amino-acid acetyltransferase ArgJ [Alphaproteobacteria bacterium]
MTQVRKKTPAKARPVKDVAPAGGSHPVSPLAPKKFANLPPLAGVRLATGAAGVRYQNRTDVLLAVFAPGTQVAGVFTRSKTASAPVEWCKANLKAGTARALVVNSGNANAFTGKAGQEGTRSVAQSAAACVGCRATEVFLASTGVIGEPLPAEKITRLLGSLAQDMSSSGWRAAAEAIMTTDTFPKLATATAVIDGKKVTINGIAKGSGMIAPDMATMLSFVVTDANLPAPVLQELLSAGVKPSFNAITVDSDTSTSDTLLLFATGKGASHVAITKANDKRLGDFCAKLDSVLLDLALQVVRDGEGAQKLIRVDIAGAENDAAAKRIALSIANSPLVKTAIAGGDANWGRVVMAVGKAGEKADRDKLAIRFGNQLVAEKGERAAKYDEAAATKAVSGLEVEIAVDLALGKGKARVWTCDLTHGYIDINGSYRS